jgi:hypothetical protein
MVQLLSVLERAAAMNFAAEKLLPHRAPMCFIETLTQADAGCARATARLTADHFAVANGVVTEAALIECVAQTFAAALGWREDVGVGAASRRDRFGSTPRIAAGTPLPHQMGAQSTAALGMLAAVTDFQIHHRPPAGLLLEIEVRELRRLGPLRLIAGTITGAGQRLAEGELTVYA